MLNLLSGLLGNVVKPVANVFAKREERKHASVMVEGKIAAAKVAGANEVNLSRAEWESLAVGQLKDSWKDEYITLIVTSPLVMIILGAVYFVFTGDTRLIDAATLAIAKLAEVGIDMGSLMLPVVLAAIGIRGLAKLGR